MRVEGILETQLYVDDANGVARLGAFELGSAAERQRELLRGSAAERWGSRRAVVEAMLGEQAGDVLGGGGHFDPSHGSAASDAALDVFCKDMLEQPSPAAGSGLVVAVVEREHQLELVAPSRGRLVIGRASRTARRRGRGCRLSRCS